MIYTTLKRADNGISEKEKKRKKKEKRKKKLESRHQAVQ